MGRVLALWTVVCVTWTLTWSLKLAAFNVQKFGAKKADDYTVMGHLADIAVRYDIILIQEILSETAINALINRINNVHNVTMTKEISERKGRTVYNEQYAFLYRADKGIAVADVFPDKPRPQWASRFERPPFIVRFCYNDGEVADFTLVGLHTKPDEAVWELRALQQVYNSIRNDWNTINIIILGDLNAGHNYVKSEDWERITVHKDNSNFWWPIEDDEDTMVKSSSNNAHDRFIIAGKPLRDAVERNSPKPFDFKTEYRLTEKQAMDVSDHFPIELEMKERLPAKRPKLDTRRRRSAGFCKVGSSGQTALFDVLVWRYVLAASVAMVVRANVEL